MLSPGYLIYLSLIMTPPEVLLGIQLSPDTELRATLEYIQEQVESKEWKEEDVCYKKFFTSYALPLELRQPCDNALSFVLNSCAYYKTIGLTIQKPLKVSRTLTCIDIRDFGWTTEQWNDVYSVQSYFKDPVVSHRLYNYGRLTAGNILFRADWFIVNATDVSKQVDRGDEENIIYYILLYGKGKQPKNAREFQEFWKVDIDTIRIEKVETGTVINQGDSGVSRHTRQVRRGRTVFGYYYETRDVKSHEFINGKKFTRDFLEDIFANFFDAAEYITSHRNGLQVYFLTVGNNNKVKTDNFKRVDIADTTVVIDKSDQEDVRIRTAKSCMVCHPAGINPCTNEIKRIFDNGGDIYTKYKSLKREIQSFYLKTDVNDLIKEDNLLYERAVRACNTLDPIDNAKEFAQIYDWYTKKVTIAQAAKECGVPLAVYRKKIRSGATGRLVSLFGRQSIPRETWDSNDAGVYIQSMLLIRRINDHTPIVPMVVKLEVETIVDRAVLVDDNNEVVGYLSKGNRYVVEAIYQRDWFKITSNSGLVGWLHIKHVKVGPK